MRATHVLLAALFAFLGPACLRGAFAADDAPPASRTPTTLDELDKRLQDLTARLKALILEAQKDPDERLIDLYKNYTRKELERTRGRTRAEDLVERFVINPDKNWNARKRAVDAIHEGGAYKNDPDLSDSEKSGPRTRRSAWSERCLVKYLNDDDQDTRGLVSDLLVRWWGSQPAIVEIARYDPRDKDTWKPAIAKWKSLLRKR